MKEQKHEALAVSVYIHAMRKQIEEEIESRYSKRIDYLIGANNELARELEKSEEERTKMAEISNSILLGQQQQQQQGL